MNPSLRVVYGTMAAAFALWYWTFAWPGGNFWLKLTCSASLLAWAGWFYSRREWKALFAFRPRHLGVGIASALLLYAIFWVGREVSTLLFPFAAGQIASVHATKSQLDARWIALLLFFLMGPAEEIYWRGFVQRRLVERWGVRAGVLGTAIVYALVHAVSWNFMLVGAAGVCGLFWGVLYQREKSLVPVILSHSLWDVLIFILIPIA